jgi:hypothetical protein
MDGAEGEWTMILPLAFLLISGSPQSAIVVESFEQPEEFRLGGVQIHPDSQLRLSEKDAFEGKRCAELRYKFEQVSGLQYLEVIAPHKLTEKPRRISVAVRGDDSGNIVRMRFVDTNGEWHQYDLGVLHFRGWKVLWTHLDTPHGHWGGDGNGRLDFPITFFSIVLDSLVRPSEGVVAFDAVTAYYGEEQKILVEAKFEPTNQWGYFWSKKDIPSGKLKLTCTGSQALTIEVSVQLLNHREEPIRQLWKGKVSLSPAKPFERSISLPLVRFGVYFVDVEVKAENFPPSVSRTSICWLPEPAPTWDESPFGVCTHFGQFKHKVPETLELIKRMGATWIRDELYWSNIERERNKFQFPEYYDAYMKAAGELGIRPLIIFNYANRHYDNGLAPHTEEGRQAFARYCVELMNRYGQICQHWEVWNEPNIGFWQPKPNPEDYTNLLKTVYETVKKVDLKATVVGVCTAGTDSRFIEEVLKRGGGKFMDAISVHPYRYPRSPEATGFVDEMKRLRELLDKYDVGQLKVWLTEFGYPTHITGGTPQWLSAAYIVRTFLWALTLPFIERLFVYDFQDDGEDPTYNEFNFGLIRFDSSPKVGYAAFNTMVRMLHRKKFARQVEIADGVVCFVFSGSDGEVWALWSSDDKERKVSLSVPSKSITVTDLMGNTRTVHPAKGQITLTLTAEPIFIRPQS